MNKKAYILIALILILLHRESVFASVVVQYSNLGQTYTAEYTASTNIIQTLNYTATTTINRLRVRVTNGVCPSLIGSGSQSYVKSTDFRTFGFANATLVEGKYCDMELRDTGNNQPITSGKILDAIYLYNGTGTQMIVEGSSANTGSIVSKENRSFTSGGIAFALCDSGDCTGALPDVAPTATNTRIISFTPEEGDILASSTPVNFTLNYYINENDVGSIASVRVKFHNIDQNTIFSYFSDNDIYFIDNVIATTSGAFSFSSSTMLEVGNYRIEASLDRSLAWGFLRNPFSSINTSQSHQFIVGESTFLGNISQNSYSSINTLYSTLSSTSTASLAQSCNVLSGFDTTKCLAFLFIPSGEQMKNSLNSVRDKILVKAPWGYFNRMYEIWSTTSTGTLPVINISIPFGNGEYGVASADMGDMIIGGVANIESIQSPKNGVTARDVLEPIVALLMAIGVIYTILTDITGSHKHNKHT